MEQINHHGSDKDNGRDEGGELTAAKGAAKEVEDVAAAVAIPEANGMEWQLTPVAILMLARSDHSGLDGWWSVTMKQDNKEPSSCFMCVVSQPISITGLGVRFRLKGRWWRCLKIVSDTDFWRRIGNSAAVCMVLFWFKRICTGLWFC